LFGASTPSTPAAPAAPRSQPVPAQPTQPQASNGSASLGENDVSQEAFAKTARQMMPLTPDQIKTLRYLFDQSQKAAASDPGDKPPKPTSSSVIVNLSPGSAPPVIRLRAGYVTSLVFLDSTGEAWPIQAYDLGNPKSFNIRWDQKGNTLMVQAVDTYQAGNLAVILKDHNTPVMITLMPGQQEVDYRVDLRIPGLGPNAAPSVTGLPDSGNSQLLSYLDGVPPAGSQELMVTGGPCQAWISGDRLFLRTRLTVLSPSWLSTMRSPDGTNVYELTKSPVILASARGKVIQLNIKGL
jgi:intracellular multiplication protein IcmK